MLQVNWDAAIDSGHGRMGIGLIVRDYKDFVIAAENLTKMKNLEPIAAEALVVVQAVVFSNELGLQNIILKGNAIQVVNALNYTCLSQQIWSVSGRCIGDYCFFA